MGTQPFYTANITQCEYIYTEHGPKNHKEFHVIYLILRFFLLMGCHISDEIFAKSMSLFYYLDVILLSFFIEEMFS